MVEAKESFEAVSVEHNLCTILRCFEDLMISWNTNPELHRQIAENAKKIEVAYLAARTLRVSINAASTTPRILED